MKRIFTIAVLLTTVALGASGQSPSKRSPQEGKTGEVTAVFRQYRNAINKRDVPVLERILADGFTGTDIILGTRQTRADVIEAYKANPLPTGQGGRSETVVIGDATVSIFRDTAIVTSREMQSGQDPTGQPFSVPIIQTAVLVRQKGQWHILAIHGGRIDTLQSQVSTIPATSRVSDKR